MQLLNTAERREHGVQNLDIRVLISDSGLRYQDVAAQMGISKWWLSKLMRQELSKENRSRVMKAIMELKDGDQRS